MAAVAWAPLSLVEIRCCLCGADDAEPIAIGEDFEYRSSPDTFLAYQCHACGLVYLHPRPSETELTRIYPPEYHAFNFSLENYGLVFRVRRRLEASRLLSLCRNLRADARILDVGCGDGFHLGLLRDFGEPSWRLEGVDTSENAVRSASQKGLNIWKGSVQDLNLSPASYDLALLIATIEHTADPTGILQTIRRLLRPGGKLLIVTDNTRTLDFRIFKHRHWGGYHFPRHWNLFNASNLATLCTNVGFEVQAIDSLVSPVNWVYSIRNSLVDFNAPRWLVNRFSLESAASLAFFTIFDSICRTLGEGALLRAIFRRPS
jgi:SAM-dependent methyltransferase